MGLAVWMGEMKIPRIAREGGRGVRMVGHIVISTGWRNPVLAQPLASIAANVGVIKPWHSVISCVSQKGSP